MTCIKYLLALALSISIFITNASSKSLNATIPLAGSDHLIVGNRHPNDRLVLQENVAESASWIGLIVEYRGTYNAPKGYVITQVCALNEVTDGTGASVILSSGGPGSDFAVLDFESQRFHGIYFTVQLYARKL